MLCIGPLAFLAGCGELKTAALTDAGAGSSVPGAANDSEAGEAPDASVTGGDPDPNDKKDGGPPPPGFGAGPYGALPSGYCCTDDADCRNRRCEDLGGGKMCLDACRANRVCQRPPELSWTCDTGGVPRGDGVCKPSGAFTCIPAAKYELGSRVAGDCCTVTGDGWAGLECSGGRCVALGDSPFVCTHTCVTPKDCPSGFICASLDETRKDCVPANQPYTCR